MHLTSTQWCCIAVILVTYLALACPDNNAVILATAAGTIRSDVDGAGGTQYGVNQNCMWTVRCPETYTLNVTLHGHVESGHDFVNFLDGAQVGFYRKSGNLLADMSLPYRQISILFQSDAVIASSGFDVGYQCVAPPRNKPLNGTRYLVASLVDDMQAAINAAAVGQTRQLSRSDGWSHTTAWHGYSEADTPYTDTSCGTGGLLGWGADCYYVSMRDNSGCTEWHPAAGRTTRTRYTFKQDFPNGVDIEIAASSIFNESTWKTLPSTVTLPMMKIESSGFRHSSLLAFEVPHLTATPQIRRVFTGPIKAGDSFVLAIEPMGDQNNDTTHVDLRIFASCDDPCTSSYCTDWQQAYCVDGVTPPIEAGCFPSLSSLPREFSGPRYLIASLADDMQAASAASAAGATRTSARDDGWNYFQADVGETPFTRNFDDCAGLSTDFGNGFCYFAGLTSGCAVVHPGDPYGVGVRYTFKQDFPTGITMELSTSIQYSAVDFPGTSLPHVSVETSGFSSTTISPYTASYLTAGPAVKKLHTGPISAGDSILIKTEKDTDYTYNEMNMDLRIYASCSDPCTTSYCTAWWQAYCVDGVTPTLLSGCFPSVAPLPLTPAPPVATTVLPVTTPAPAAATDAPTVATAAPTTSTAAPTVTTAAPAVTTVAPTTATEAPPPATTAAPPVTTGTAPSVTTGQSVVAPTGTTAAAGATTGVPTVTTRATSPTAAPTSSSQATTGSATTNSDPRQTTAALHATTVAPVVMTNTPAATTEASDPTTGALSTSTTTHTTQPATVSVTTTSVPHSTSAATAALTSATTPVPLAAVATEAPDLQLRGGAADVVASDNVRGYFWLDGSEGEDTVATGTIAAGVLLSVVGAAFIYAVWRATRGLEFTQSDQLAARVATLTVPVQVAALLQLLHLFLMLPDERSGLSHTLGVLGLALSMFFRVLSVAGALSTCRVRPKSSCTLTNSCLGRTMLLCLSAFNPDLLAMHFCVRRSAFVAWRVLGAVHDIAMALVAGEWARQSGEVFSIIIVLVSVFCIFSSFVQTVVSLRSLVAPFSYVDFDDENARKCDFESVVAKDVVGAHDDYETVSSGGDEPASPAYRGSVHRPSGVHLELDDSIKADVEDSDDDLVDRGDVTEQNDAVPVSVLYADM